MKYCSLCFLHCLLISSNWFCFFLPFRTPPWTAWPQLLWSSASCSQWWEWMMKFQISLANVLETQCRITYQTLFCGQLNVHDVFWYTAVIHLMYSAIKNDVDRGWEMLLESACSSTVVLVTMFLHVMPRIRYRE